jgi:hypothetical protein
MSVFFPLAAAATSALSEAAVARSISTLSAGVGTCGLVAQILSGARVKGAAYFSTLLGLQLLGLVALVALIVSRRAKSAGTPSLMRDTGGVVLQAARGEDVVPVDPDVTAADPEPHAPFEARTWCDVTRHLHGMRAAGIGALGGIMSSCVLEFAMPGMLPYLAPPSDATALFWLTCLWAISSVVGRAIAAWRSLSVCELIPANVLQALLLGGAIACAAAQAVPPIALAAPLVALFSIAHGLVVTSAYVLASASDPAGTTYAGLANQAGALLGSLLSLLLVSTGLLPKK